MRDVLITKGCHVIWWNWNCSHLKCEINHAPKINVKKCWSTLVHFAKMSLEQLITRLKLLMRQRTVSLGVLLPDLTRPGHHWASLWGVNLGAQNGLGNNVLEVFYWPRPGGLGGLNSFILQESPAHSSHWVSGIVVHLEELGSCCTKVGSVRRVRGFHLDP